MGEVNSKDVDVADKPFENSSKKKNVNQYFDEYFNCILSMINRAIKLCSSLLTIHVEVIRINMYLFWLVYHEV